MTVAQVGIESQASRNVNTRLVVDFLFRTFALIRVATLVFLQRANKNEVMQHSQDEKGPKNVQALQNEQHAIEEVIAKEWLIHFQRQDGSAVNDPKREDDEARDEEDGREDHEEHMG